MSALQSPLMSEAKKSVLSMKVLRGLSKQINKKNLKILFGSPETDVYLYVRLVSWLDTFI